MLFGEYYVGGWGRSDKNDKSWNFCFVRKEVKIWKQKGELWKMLGTMNYRNLWGRRLLLELEQQREEAEKTGGGNQSQGASC